MPCESVVPELRGGKKEWTELTDLVAPTQFDAKFVRIQVQRFSG